MGNPSTILTRGSTYDNRANLAEAFFEQIITKYEGTTLGRQELMGELIEDVEGALWTRGMIDNHRVKLDDVPSMKRIAVAVDPATTFGESSDQTGLAVAGIGDDGEFYVFFGQGYRVSPQTWGSKAIDLHGEYQADTIVAESNQGGEMVRQTILNAARDRRIKPKVQLIHASRGKRVRAEPVAALYEQGKVHHIGLFSDLEDEMCNFPVTDDHDDMVDALVHAISAVGIKPLAKVRSF